MFNWFHGKGRSIRVWIIIEYPYVTGNFKVWIYFPQIRKSKQQITKRFLKKVAPYIYRLFGAVGLTYLYLIWVTEQALIQRGYKAYGGEYIIVPFVFYGFYKILGIVGKFFRKKR